jgi:hypothetical protein
MRNIFVVYVLFESLSTLFVLHSLMENRFTDLAAGNALHCCDMAGRHSAVFLCCRSADLISYFHPCPPSTWHLQQPFVSPRLTDSSPYYTYAGETTGVVSHNSSYAGQAVCSILVLYTVRPLPSSSFGKALSWGSVCLINALRGRNNRMDLTHEPPVTYVTTMDAAASLDNMGSPTRRYVLNLPFAEHSEQGC